MTDSISPVTRLAPTSAPRPVVASDAAAFTSIPSVPAADVVTPEPAKPSVALSVDRDQSGVFVYTLTDSASGRVIAVIPRSAVASRGAGSDRGGVDIQA